MFVRYPSMLHFLAFLLCNRRAVFEAASFPVPYLTSVMAAVRLQKRTFLVDTEDAMLKDGELFAMSQVLRLHLT